MKIKAEYIEEPNLIFGDLNEEKDPRLGLDYHGPYRYSDERTPISEIKIGIIGDSSSIQKCKTILVNLQKETLSLESNKWLYPSFPGLSKNTNFKCELKVLDIWREGLIGAEIDNILKIPNANERIEESSNLFLIGLIPRSLLRYV